jgi:heme A synthase
MADPIWPTPPWYLITYDKTESGSLIARPGFLVEHTHRAAGYTVGCCVIVLAVGLLRSRTARWLKGLGLAALAAVIVQGLLGGFRVRLNAILGHNLALIHGLFAQVVFSILVSVAVCTWPRFATAALPAEDAHRLRTPATLLSGLVLLQLSFGAMLRHLGGPFVQRAHLVTAFAVVGTAVWLAAEASTRSAARSLLRWPLVLLGALLAVQVCLGVEAWLGKFEGVALPEAEAVTFGQAAVRTGHVIAGACILATSVTLALLVWRPAAEPYPQPEGTP